MDDGVPRSLLLDHTDRLPRIGHPALAGPKQSHANRLGKTLCPQIGRDPHGPRRDLALVSRVDGERDEAQAGVADGDVVNVQIELSGEGFGGGAGHTKMEAGAVSHVCAGTVPQVAERARRLAAPVAR